MHNPHLPSIHLFQRPQSRQRQAVVTAEGNQLWSRPQIPSQIPLSIFLPIPLPFRPRPLSLLPPPLPLPRRTPQPQLQKSFTHLLQRHSIIKRRNRDIATINNGCPTRVRVDAGARVEAPEGSLAAGGLADGAGAEAGALWWGRGEG